MGAHSREMLARHGCQNEPIDCSSNPFSATGRRAVCQIEGYAHSDGNIDPTEQSQNVRPRCMLPLGAKRRNRWSCLGSFLQFLTALRLPTPTLELWLVLAASTRVRGAWLGAEWRKPCALLQGISPTGPLRLPGRGAGTRTPAGACRLSA